MKLDSCFFGAVTTRSYEAINARRARAADEGSVAMMRNTGLMKLFGLLLALVLAACALSSCAPRDVGILTETPEKAAEAGADTSGYLVVVDDEPDTVDFQCTSIYYTVALNVFNRLVEMQASDGGGVTIVPSLAKSWEISDDGRLYAFHLREGVVFSNGSPLTSSDVLYTLTRLLTHPDACNQDIADAIQGAEQLERGEADRLSGFEIISDLDFTITLEKPFSAFLACLSMPGASILDAETMETVGERFGFDAESAVGTGPFVLDSWEPGRGMTLSANPTCWSGPAASDGLELRFITDGEEQRRLFESGELDILDLDELGVSAEYFIHGDIYQDRLYEAHQINITYIALNESFAPLDDARVRKAMQLSLDRQMLLDAIYSGRGEIENGIFPRGLNGHNPDLAEIPYDPDGAAALLREAGCAEGFDLTVSVKSSSTQQEVKLMTMAASMWAKVGIRARVEVVDEDEFMRRRKAGELACYTATWNADFNDPDNFIYTFFGNRENARFRSLCYADEAVMARVRAARSIVDEAARIDEYRALEQRIVQADAAWIPLFSRIHYYVAGERVEPFELSWNGWVSTRYHSIAVREGE